VSNLYIAQNELDFACLYALRRPQLAADCAAKALFAALRARRPDLAFAANTILAIVGGES
jgi:hypothetical protein